MQLVIATPLYPPEAGGPATYAKLLEEEFPKRGIGVTLVKFSGVRGYPKLIRHFAYAWRVYKAAWDADMVLALDPVSVGLPAWFAASLASKPFYLRVAGDYAWEQGTQRYGVTELLDEFILKRKYPMSVRILRFVQTFVAKRARRIIVPSEYLKHVVSVWGIRPERIAVVYNAPPFEVPSVLPPRPRNAPLSYIAVIARLVPWKGVPAVLHAFDEVRKHADIGLVIVGDGPERTSLTALVHELSLDEAVVFTGTQPHEETLAYLGHAKAFVLNTGYEGLSHLILEAFALHVPVITTAVGGNPELVTDTVTGLVVPFNDENALRDALLKLLSDEKIRRHVVHEAEKVLSGFTREGTVTGSLAALTL